MCLMFTLWGASPLGVISNVSPLGVPQGNRSSLFKWRIANPPERLAVLRFLLRLAFLRFLLRLAGAARG